MRLWHPTPLPMIHLDKSSMPTCQDATLTAQKKKTQTMVHTVIWAWASSRKWQKPTPSTISPPASISSPAPTSAAKLTILPVICPLQVPCHYDGHRYKTKKDPNDGSNCRLGLDMHPTNATSPRWPPSTKQGGGAWDPSWAPMYVFLFFFYTNVVLWLLPNEGTSRNSSWGDKARGLRYVEPLVFFLTTQL